MVPSRVKGDERMPFFANRCHAGRLLASALVKCKSQARENGIVLALPRGRVPMAFRGSAPFGVPLDGLLQAPRSA
jgi:predicted phosphoribosyltransferase